MSFGCYMEGVRLIGGTKTSLFASIEPLTATVISILFMGVAFSCGICLALWGLSEQLQSCHYRKRRHKEGFYMKESQGKGLISVHIAVALFGFVGLFAKLVDLPAVIIVLGRVFFSSIFLWLFLRFKKQKIRLEEKSDYFWMIGAGMVLAVHWSSYMAVDSEFDCCCRDAYGIYISSICNFSGAISVS